MLRLASSIALFVFASVSAMACSSRVPVGTEGTGGGALRQGDPTNGAPTQEPTKDAGSQTDAGPTNPTTPTTCGGLAAGQCDSVPGCRECGPTELCATPCVGEPLPSCSTTDPVECESRAHCKVCSPVEDCMCKPKHCDELSETICERVPGCGLCPPTAFCTTVCLEVQ